MGNPEGKVPELIGGSEIIKLLRLSKQHCRQLMNEPQFPAPVAWLGQGKVWALDDVVAWARTRMRG